MKGVAVGFVLAIVLIGGAAYGYYWWRTRPGPPPAADFDVALVSHDCEANLTAVFTISLWNNGTAAGDARLYFSIENANHTLGLLATDRTYPDVPPSLGDPGPGPLNDTARFPIDGGVGASCSDPEWTSWTVQVIT